MNKHEQLNYVEYGAVDLDKTKLFFTETFNWQFTDYGENYSAFSTGQLDGGFYTSKLVNLTEQGGALLVFYSEDINATLAKIVKNGGKITKPIFEFPGGCRFHFLEPSGNEFAVWSESE